MTLSNVHDTPRYLIEQHYITIFSTNIARKDNFGGIGLDINHLYEENFPYELAFHKHSGLTFHPSDGWNCLYPGLRHSMHVMDAILTIRL